MSGLGPRPPTLSSSRLRQELEQRGGKSASLSSSSPSARGLGRELRRPRFPRGGAPGPLVKDAPPRRFSAQVRGAKYVLRPIQP